MKNVIRPHHHRRRTIDAVNASRRLDREAPRRSSPDVADLEKKVTALANAIPESAYA